MKLTSKNVEFFSFHKNHQTLAEYFKYKAQDLVTVHPVLQFTLTLSCQWASQSGDMVKEMRHVEDSSLVAVHFFQVSLVVSIHFSRWGW